MKRVIVLFLAMVSIATTAFSDDRWTPYRTNNSETDDIRDIITESNTIWCATNGGIVKWDITTGTYTIYNPGGNDKAMFSAVKDWNGVEWFGSWQTMPIIGGGHRACVYTHKDSAWTSLTWENTEVFNKYYNGVVNKIIPDAINKRLIFVVSWSQSTKSYCTLLSYDGEKWKELVSTGLAYLIPFAIDTINPWDIWGGGLGSGIYFFKKEMQGYVSNYIQFEMSDGGFHRMAIDSDNRIWMTTFNNIYLYDRTWLTPTRFGPEITGAIGRAWNVVIDRNRVKWFGSDGALVRYDDKTWSAYPFQPLDEQDSVTALAVDESGDIWMGRGSDGKGHGLYRFHPTQTDVHEEAALPHAVKIIGNTPNPFNPSTSITFSLAFPGIAELAVFSAAGQRIRTLVSHGVSAGTHTIAWDGRDDFGRQVSSGVYFSRLTAGKSVAVGKMALVR